MFGDNILATALCQPADTLTGLTERTVWFPEGNDWYDMATGEMIEGGKCDTLHYTMNENPYYVKAGAIIPMAPEGISSLQEKNNGLVVFVAPGDGESSTLTYEDDGVSQAYATEYATTEISKTSDRNGARVVVSPKKGSYKGMSETRQLTFVLEGVFAPTEVKVNGKQLEYSRFGEDDTWTYDGRNLALKVILSERNASEEVVMECSYSPEAAAGRDIIYGKKGLLNRMADMTPEMKYVFGDNVDRYLLLPVPFLKVAQCSSLITEDPDNAMEYLATVDIDAMNSALSEYDSLPDSFLSRVRAQSDL